jgi:asparagine synthase (glutamine-hydrolysing)
MCGIVGFISKVKQLKILNNMLEIQSHRGPDDKGMYFDGKTGVHLGHNRLSILDLSHAGHQPMITNCGNYVIVYNGEVYNFREIKKELIKKGYKFNSYSDTEVILYSLIEWGIEALHKFIGMFAITFYDKKNQKLFLIRDRAGVKPLYYYFDEIFMFSSEIKSFHKHPKFKKEINYEILSYYFRLGYIPAPFSIFKNCFKLEAGHYLEFDIKNNTFEIKKYWEVEEFYKKEKLDLSENEILKELESILDSAINYRVIADVPVGVFLSGGYDSSFVSAILSKNKKINTFTIGFDDKKYNEAKHAKEIAKYLNTNHTEYYMKKEDVFELIDDLPFLYDEPFGDSSALPTILISKLAKQQIKVVLSADGGDEIFFGYSKYKFLYSIFPFFTNSFKKRLLQMGLSLLNEDYVEKMNLMLPKNSRQTNIKEKFLKFKRAINSENIYEMFLNSSSYLSENEVKQYLKMYDKKVFNKFYDNDLDFFDYMMMIDYKTFMVDDVLVKVDRATMGVSIEGREPLLDHRIVEFVARIPKGIKYKNNQNKYLLRQILYKYIPKNLVDKPKSGFQIPLNEWLKSDLRYLIDKYINSRTLDRSIFNVEDILNLKKEFLTEKNNYHSFLWFIIMYEMWREKWLK